ncbi:type II secretion system protein N [Aquabacterium sp.]|uniref:type II secretion system protein N n=1 Tax=Aquabacterium sp. TaxID=1872578 RepID=UPI0025BED336|nr:type II secretion system protein N [Aquabacterium sp.]
MAGIPFINKRPAWMQGAGALTTRWLESTMEIARWETMRKAGRRWGWWGAGIGALAGMVVYAPASWLAQGVVELTGKRLLLAESQGTIWKGDAVAVLTGGAGSRDARALPGRLNWRMRLQGMGLRLTLQQDCCMPTPVVVLVELGLGRIKTDVRLQTSTTDSSVAAMASQGEIGHWPAAWLGGLGTPWNTLQLGGVVRLSAQDLSIEVVQGRARIQGQANLALDNVSSRVTTLDRLGSYRLDLSGDAQGQLQMAMITVDGALQLSGQGGMSSGGMRFRGEARASDAEKGALDNLLNIIGRREGDRSVISIG